MITQKFSIIVQFSDSIMLKVYFKRATTLCVQEDILVVLVVWIINNLYHDKTLLLIRREKVYKDAKIIIVVSHIYKTITL